MVGFSHVFSLWCLLPGLLLVTTGCRSRDRLAADSAVKTGAEVLASAGFGQLSGMRVGLIANQTTRVDSTSLIDLLAGDSSVHLDALFGPEHGLRGLAQAGESVVDDKDVKTGIPVYSLFGERSAPDSTVLSTLDILVFDIQDVGSRFYTYISTMGRAMQAAARAGLPFMILDRPNPLGGVRVDGYVLERGNRSGVGLYEIPIQHGLTVGELGQMIQAEKMLPGLEGLDLRIVPMKGWRRDMLWSDTGLDWVPTSPNIPTFETALVYAGTCFFEGTTASEGRGTPEPFLSIGAPWLPAGDLVAKLAEAALPGVTFKTGLLEPVSIPGKSMHPRFEGDSFDGIRIHVSDISAYRPMRVGVEILVDAFRVTPDSLRDRFLSGRWLRLLAGTDRLETDIRNGLSAESIVDSWSDEVADFSNRRLPYLLYGETQDPLSESVRGL